MDREAVIRMAREAGLVRTGDKWVEPARWGVTELVHFANLVAAAEREKLAAWMIQRGFATGHGDTVEDLLKELEWQIAEREREACASICFQEGPSIDGQLIAEAIRARSEK